MSRPYNASSGNTESPRPHHSTCPAAPLSDPVEHESTVRDLVDDDSPVVRDPTARDTSGTASLPCALSLGRVSSLSLQEKHPNGHTPMVDTGDDSPQAQYARAQPRVLAEPKVDLALLNVEVQRGGLWTPLCVRWMGGSGPFGSVRLAPDCDSVDCEILELVHPALTERDGLEFSLATDQGPLIIRAPSAEKKKLWVGAVASKCPLDPPPAPPCPRRRITPSTRQLLRLPPHIQALLLDALRAPPAEAALCLRSWDSTNPLTPQFFLDQEGALRCENLCSIDRQLALLAHEEDSAAHRVGQRLSGSTRLSTKSLRFLQDFVKKAGMIVGWIAAASNLEDDDAQNSPNTADEGEAAESPTEEVEEETNAPIAIIRGCGAVITADVGAARSDGLPSSDAALLLFSSGYTVFGAVNIACPAHDRYFLTASSVAGANKTVRLPDLLRAVEVAKVLCVYGPAAELANILDPAAWDVPTPYPAPMAVHAPVGANGFSFERLQQVTVSAGDDEGFSSSQCLQKLVLTAVPAPDGKVSVVDAKQRPHSIAEIRGEVRLTFTDGLAADAVAVVARSLVENANVTRLELVASSGDSVDQLAAVSSAITFAPSEEEARIVTRFCDAVSRHANEGSAEEVEVDEEDSSVFESFADAMAVLHSDTTYSGKESAQEGESAPGTSEQSAVKTTQSDEGIVRPEITEVIQDGTEKINEPVRLGTTATIQPQPIVAVEGPTELNLAPLTTVSSASEPSPTSSPTSSLASPPPRTPIRGGSLTEAGLFDSRSRCLTSPHFSLSPEEQEGIDAPTPEPRADHNTPRRGLPRPLVVAAVVITGAVVAASSMSLLFPQAEVDRANSSGEESPQSSWTCPVEHTPSRSPAPVNACALDACPIANAPLPRRTPWSHNPLYQSTQCPAAEQCWLSPAVSDDEFRCPAVPQSDAAPVRRTTAEGTVYAVPVAVVVGSLFFFL